LKRKIAVIPNDDIGPEVTREGVKVLQFVSGRSRLDLDFVAIRLELGNVPGVWLPAGRSTTCEARGGVPRRDESAPRAVAEEQDKIGTDAVQISVSWSPVKTTLDLSDDLLSKAQQQAAKEHISLTRMIEEGLTLRLRRSRNGPRQLKPLPVSRRKGGLRQGIDGRSNKSLFDAAD
jgi:hypothetical protein